MKQQVSRTKSGRRSRSRNKSESPRAPPPSDNPAPDAAAGAAATTTVVPKAGARSPAPKAAARSPVPKAASRSPAPKVTTRATMPEQVTKRTAGLENVAAAAHAPAVVRVAPLPPPERPVEPASPAQLSAVSSPDFPIAVEPAVETPAAVDSPLTKVIDPATVDETPVTPPSPPVSRGASSPVKPVESDMSSTFSNSGDDAVDVGTKTVKSPSPRTANRVNTAAEVAASPASPQPAVVVAAVAVPVEPEEHVDGDVVESVIRKLKGTRPELLRTITYYEGAKSVYTSLAGLPVLNGIAPTVESVAESIINMTPLKPSPEEQAEQKSVDVLDKRICDALSYADEVVDSKKDDTIESIVSVKKAINTLGPVQSAVGVACDVGDGVGKVYGCANDTVGNVWHQACDAVSNTYNGVTTMAGDAVHCVTNTAGDAVKHVTDTTGRVVESAKSTAGSTVEGAKSMVGSTADCIGSNVNWATSTAMSLLHSAISFPVDVVQSILGTKKEPAPED